MSVAGAPIVAGEATRPRDLLVAIISTTPIFCEAMTDVFGSFAEVRRVSARPGDTGGFLRALRPDAIVMEAEAELEEATDFACESGAALLHVSLVDATLRSWSRGRWTSLAEDAWSPESIRNALVSAMYSRGGAE